MKGQNPYAEHGINEVRDVQLGGNVSLSPKVALVSSKNVPAIIVDLGEVGVTGFEEGDSVLVPWGVVTEVLLGKRASVQCPYDWQPKRQDEGQEDS
jgi:hypothetical protein